MKKSTLLLLAVAILLGGVVYYYEFKHPPKPAESADEPKPAFTFQPGDVVNISIQHGDDSMDFVRQGEEWTITKPVQTRADRRVLEGLATSLSSASIARAITGGAAQPATYGLDKPAAILNFQLKDGKKHDIRLGTADFTGSDVYAQVDGGKDVDLLSNSLLTASSKPLLEFRDRAVLQITAGDVAWFDLKNSTGEISGTREGKDRWRMEKPRATRGSDPQITSLLAQVASARMNSIASETDEGLAKYGLDHPAITFQVRDAKGATQTLLLGKKSGEDYFARDASRPMIFVVGQDLYGKLNENFEVLRDKNLLRADADSLTGIEVHNDNQTIVAHKTGDDWILDQPADQKGKKIEFWKVFDPLSFALAKEVLDRAPANVAAALAKPAITAALTDKSGKVIHASISGVIGESCYGRTDEGEEVYKFDRGTFDQLNFKTADILETPAK